MWKHTTVFISLLSTAFITPNWLCSSYIKRIIEGVFMLAGLIFCFKVSIPVKQNNKKGG